MKIRNGFVSNSSSSSYVIAYKEPEACPHCGRNDTNIISLIENSNGNGETCVSAMGYDEVVENIKEWFDDSGRVIKEMDELNDGTYNFSIVEISYHEETLETLLHNNKSIKILHGG